MKETAPDFFAGENARRYDERSSKLAAITEALHFLTSLVLEGLPADARVLVVGAGTGAEIISLAQFFPEWSFVATDPSLSMLDVCRERMQTAGLSDRCEFFHGFAHDLPPQPAFDAATAFLVAHFVPRTDRLAFYQSMSDRLRFGGFLVTAEISYDLDALEYPSMLGNWQSVQRLMGGTPESLKAVPTQLREVLSVISPAETESLIREAGIATPVSFFQAFMIRAWYGAK